MRVATRGAVLALCGLAATGIGAAPRSEGIERLAWLQGCWETVSPEQSVEEQWMAPRGKSMVGISRTVRGDSLVGHELVVVREDGDHLAYQAHPSGQPSAVFTSRTLREGEVVFENLQHDFPQRIGYQRKGPSLLAWIEGPQQGQNRRIEFPYRKTPCPGD